MWELKSDRGRQWWEFNRNPAVVSFSCATALNSGQSIESIPSAYFNITSSFGVHKPPVSPVPDSWTAKYPALQQDLNLARQHFVANRFTQKHAADMVLRTCAKHNILWDGNQKNRDEVDPVKNPLPESLAQDPVSTALFKGMQYFSSLQLNDGHWGGDYGGPMFLMPGFIFACYITNTPIYQEHKREMLRYLDNIQNQNGGYGLHIEGHSTMFGTALNYVAMRILGREASHPVCVAARKWILSHGTAVSIPSWGKFWLATLNLYDWRGMNPVTPDLWCLPYWLPVHPGRFWCHCRIVYLPMSYVYGCRFSMPVNKLISELRNEIYGFGLHEKDALETANHASKLSKAASSSVIAHPFQPGSLVTVDSYQNIPWSKYCNNCCEADEYFKKSWLQKLLWKVLYMYEWSPIFRPLRAFFLRFALKETILQIKQEDKNTNWICIGPVNKVMNFLSSWIDDPLSDHTDKHRARLNDYLWLAEDGMKMQGYNGSQLWDTAFAVQAFATSLDVAKHFPNTLRAAHHFLDMTQVREDVPEMERFYRHISNGAWPFSTRDHGWPIADCSSEGLKATLALQLNNGSLHLNLESMIPKQRLQQCIDVILSFQNPGDHGWATYELTRTGSWVEFMNPSEVFGNIMIDYSYVELSSACITAMCQFREAFPDYRRNEVDRAIKTGVEFIQSIQWADGSWYGSWAVCFVYGTWFGIEALVATGHTLEDCEPLYRACNFLVSKQRADGSWGESYLSSQDKVYSQSEDGQVVSTAWALLSLSRAKWKDREPLRRAAAFLCSRQMEDGDWPQQLICGVFNHNCMITYINYRCVFSLWALGEYRNTYLLKKESS